MDLVAGIDSSTQSCKVVIRDAETGELLRSGSAKHDPGTEIDPMRWWTALHQAVDAAGGTRDVAALSVGGQQHGLVALDADGSVIRPALLWNDTRSAQAAVDLVDELGEGNEELGRRRWAEQTGSVPVASFTVTKLRWLADHEPENAAQIAAIALPHDWLTWQLAGADGLDSLVTDRSEVSGTGYYDVVAGNYRRELLALALRRDDVDDIVLPRVVEPGALAAQGAGDFAQSKLGPGCGDNAGAALGLGMTAGQTSLSLGTSGVVAAVSEQPTTDPTGLVTGFADATGAYLPLACTLNASRILDATARLLGVDYAELGRLALAAEPGAGGLVHVPFLEGERTPNLPHATGSWFGMTLQCATRENLARAAVEGMLCLMGFAADAVAAQGVPVEQITLIGGGARSEAVCRIAPSVLGMDVDVAAPGEYVADGAARQACWVLSGQTEPPAWDHVEVQTYSAPSTPEVRRRWDHFADLVTAEQQAT